MTQATSGYLNREARQLEDVAPPLHTPWGATQTKVRLAEGIWLVETASHGGIWLAPARRAQVPQYVVKATHLKSAQWFEEDCDQAWPRVIFGAEIGPVQQDQAIKFLERHKPDLLERYLADVHKA